MSSASARAEPARPADDLVDAIGTNVHFSYANYIDQFESVVVPRLQELGIRHIRDGILLADEPFNERVRAVGAFGVKGTFITRPKQFPALVEWAKSMAPYIETLEGPNEPHNEPESYLGLEPMASLKPYQQDLYAAVRAEPMLAKVKVATPGIDWFPAYGSVGDLDAWTDYGNFHHWPPSTGKVPYKGSAPTDGLFRGRDGEPSGGLLTQARSIASTKPLLATETGWATTQVTPTAGGGWDPGVSEAAAARYATRVMLELFNHGVRRAFIYELLDEPQTPDPVKKHQGMLTIDGALKPHAVALKNLIGLLADAGPPFTPTSLEFSLSSQGAPLQDDHDHETADVHHLLLQKRSGVFYLLIWNEALSYDNQAETDIAVPDQTVTLQLSEPLAQARTFRPLAGSDALETFDAPQELVLAVPDHPLIVELTPRSLPEHPAGGAGGGGGRSTGGEPTVIPSAGGAFLGAAGSLSASPEAGSLTGEAPAPSTLSEAADGAGVSGCGCNVAESSGSSWAALLVALWAVRLRQPGRTLKSGILWRVGT